MPLKTLKVDPLGPDLALDYFLHVRARNASYVQRKAIMLSKNKLISAGNLKKLNSDIFSGGIFQHCLDFQL